MNENLITAAKSTVVALVAGIAIWTVGGAATHTLSGSDHTARTSTTVLAEGGNWGVAPGN
ncbi:hypothetical protein ACGFYV_10830 [Streptomyces sp. NPDC048297]|uniref:hypothetical protein n=1 Tax=Streptomyces sp. NPDC048297 TaxID=3365531 RepID=UPI003714781E